MRHKIKVNLAYPEDPEDDVEDEEDVEDESEDVYDPYEGEEDDNDVWDDGSVSGDDFDEQVAKLLSEENQKSEEEHERYLSLISATIVTTAWEPNLTLR